MILGMWRVDDVRMIGSYQSLNRNWGLGWPRQERLEFVPERNIIQSIEGIYFMSVVYDCRVSEGFLFICAIVVLGDLGDQLDVQFGSHGWFNAVLGKSKQIYISFKSCRLPYLPNIFFTNPRVAEVRNYRIS